jgi:hypothetical protein
MVVLEEIMQKYLQRIFDAQKRKETLNSEKQEKLVKDA